MDLVLGFQLVSSLDGSPTESRGATYAVEGAHGGEGSGLRAARMQFGVALPARHPRGRLLTD